MLAARKGPKEATRRQGSVRQVLFSNIREQGVTTQEGAAWWDMVGD